MKKILYFGILMAGAAFMHSCNDEPDFPGLDDKSKLTNIQRLEYTLTAADYKTISSNTTNKEIANTREDSLALVALGTNGYFSGVITAEKYVPAFIATKWYTLDDNSAVMVSYKKLIEPEEYVTALAEAETYTVTNEDYAAVWSDNNTDYFTPAKSPGRNIPSILRSAIQEAEEGEYRLVSYNYSDKEPGGSNAKAVIFFEEPFACESSDNNQTITLDGWINTDLLLGGREWIWQSYGGGYARVSSGNVAGTKHDTWLITPQIDLSVALSAEFTFESYVGYYLGADFTVHISTDFDGTHITSANWTNVTDNFDIPKTPTNDWGKWGTPVGDMNLSAYTGEKIYVAFRFEGDVDAVKTATYQIRNVVVQGTVPADATFTARASGSYVGTVVERNAVYQYNGASWAEASNVIMLDAEDYTEMGLSNPNFSASLAPDAYIPTYLSINYPYAKAGDVKAVVYAFYSNSQTTIQANEYTYTNGVWVNNDVQIVSEQFVLANNKWVYSPDVLLEMPADRNNAFVKQFMQNVYDYVISTHGNGYTDTNGNVSEYYYGFSPHYNNVNFQQSYWRNRCTAGEEAYGSLSTEDLEKLQFERLPEAFKIGLELMYPDIRPLESGAPLHYICYFALYNGANVTTYNYMIKYLVTGKGEFTYVEDSLGLIDE